MKRINNIFLFVLAANLATAQVSADRLDTKEEILARIQAPVFPDSRFAVTDFGAVGDSASNNKPAFDAAIQACRAAGGGTVIVPVGTYLLDGPIHLESNLNLHLEEGALIRFSANPRSYLPIVKTSWEGTLLYNYSPFIYAFGKENIAITGKGTIDGNGSAYFTRWYEIQGKDQRLSRRMNHKNVPVEERRFGRGHYLRPHLIQFFDCKNILVEDLHIQDSPFWCIHLLMCENATLRGLTFDAQNKNNDGIDPEYCKDILIENVNFNNSNDNISVKAGRDHEGRDMQRPSENIIIRNCSFKGRHAVAIGSEMSSGVRNVYIEDCRFSDYITRGIMLKSNPSRGGIISDIYVNNFRFGEVHDCFMVTSNYRNEGKKHPPTIKNIYISNVTCQRVRNFGIYIKGHKRNHVSDIHIENFRVDQAKRTVFVDFAESVNFKDTQVNNEEIKWDPAVFRKNKYRAYNY
ncbi:glycoside hydrolase family 28 protein [Gaoshiqia sp. Z1-71]|uniref:glycoside hydrolase family 28 protein n=1 Tax=Gaoshiqia hydrogeniformans TaxID=3290090 RepID=UPI003BF88254